MSRSFLSNVKEFVTKSRSKRILEEIDSLKNNETSDAKMRMCSNIKELSKMHYKDRLDLRNCSLEDVALKGIKLSRVCFWNANLKNADFGGAVLPDADFWKANLYNSNFKEAILNNTIFTEANLQQANLEKANLRSARLEDSVLKGADLTEANLRWAKVELCQLKTVKSLKNATMPDGTQYSDDWQKLIEEASPNKK